MDIQIIELENKLLKEQIKLLLEMNDFLKQHYLRLKEILREKRYECISTEFTSTESSIASKSSIKDEKTKGTLKRLQRLAEI